MQRRRATITVTYRFDWHRNRSRGTAADQRLRCKGKIKDEKEKGQDLAETMDKFQKNVDGGFFLGGGGGLV